jgi:hypothetical protein
MLDALQRRAADRPHVLGVRTTATYFSSWLAAATRTAPCYSSPLSHQVKQLVTESFVTTPHLFLIRCNKLCNSLAAKLGEVLCDAAQHLGSCDNTLMLDAMQHQQLTGQRCYGSAHLQALHVLAGSIHPHDPMFLAPSHRV